jgi:hypothetical protein
VILVLDVLVDQYEVSTAVLIPILLTVADCSPSTAEIEAPRA